MAQRLVLVVLGVMVAAGCAGAAAPPSASGSAAVPFPSGELVDLSHTYDQTTIFWPTSSPFALTKVADGETPAGFYYSANDFSAAEHGGTHIDAPVHFGKGRMSVDRLPLESLMAPAVVIDVTQASATNADYRVAVEDFSRFERRHGTIPSGSIVLLKTGFASRWPNPETYLGTAERGEAGVAKLHFPGLHPDAATWLVSNRSVKAVGIDTASIDFGQSTLYETHRILNGRDIPAFENLASLDRLPPTGSFVIALPMKIGGGSGAPLRAVAVIPAAAASSAR